MKAKLACRCSAALLLQLVLCAEQMRQLHDVHVWLIDLLPAMLLQPACKHGVLLKRDVVVSVCRGFHVRLHDKCCMQLSECGPHMCLQRLSQRRLLLCLAVPLLFTCRCAADDACRWWCC